MTITELTHSISEVADLTGVSAHTLRYYEREGLMLRAIDRATSSHRRYTAADVTWVVFLTKLRRTTMSISEMREYAAFVRQGDSTAEDRLELLLRHRVAVVAQLEEMTKSLAAIDIKIATYKEKVQ
jgi:DNA-binding transcriptional MerR regulator